MGTGNTLGHAKCPVKLPLKSKLTSTGFRHSEFPGSRIGNFQTLFGAPSDGLRVCVRYRRSRDSVSWQTRLATAACRGWYSRGRRKAGDSEQRVAGYAGIAEWLLAGAAVSAHHVRRPSPCGGGLAARGPTRAGASKPAPATRAGASKPAPAGLEAPALVGPR
jgi:hypothetical protein